MARWICADPLSTVLHRGLRLFEVSESARLMIYRESPPVEGPIGSWLPHTSALPTEARFLPLQDDDSGQHPPTKKIRMQIIICRYEDRDH